jgi:catechol 2,3-dioxygenase-like lactoylglutathione lyase family enzyme
MKIESGFGSFSVNDLEQAKAFYADTLGLTVKEPGGVGIRLELPGGGDFFVYRKEDHRPASYTVLNLRVPDLDAAIEYLTGKGVPVEKPRGGPHRIAWLKDPASNWIALMEA